MGNAFSNTQLHIAEHLMGGTEYGRHGIGDEKERIDAHGVIDMSVGMKLRAAENLTECLGRDQDKRHDCTQRDENKADCLTVQNGES